MRDGNSFWYSSGTPDSVGIHLVDPVANTKSDFFEIDRLRSALSEVLGHAPAGKGVPFAQFDFVDESEQSIRFAVEGRQLVLHLDSYAVAESDGRVNGNEARARPRVLTESAYGRPGLREILSPDLEWAAHLKGNNLWLRALSTGSLQQMTTDGTVERPWGYLGVQMQEWAWWSPDSRKLAVRRGDLDGVRQIPVVDYLGSTTTVDWVRSVHNVEAGGTLPREELHVLDLTSECVVEVDLSDREYQYLAVVGWAPDGSEVFLVRIDREYKRLDLVAADTETGAARVVLSDASETFIGDPLWLTSPQFVLLDDGARFLWSSERDGWRHHYLYRADGTMVRQLTKGAFASGRIIEVDESNGWIYFHCSRGEQPYDSPVCRVNLEGNGLAAVSAPVGRHSPVQFSPSKQFFVDNYSSITHPPVLELRRVDGTLLQTLARADVRPLQENLNWSSPEPFVVKAADGETEIYGVLYKPSNFDASKKYPVVDFIYGGPFMNTVPQTFLHDPQPQEWANLGFIVFIVEGRGTPGRSKEFQDVAYGNIGQYEIPDHAAALQQLARDRVYMDTDRVGIVGSSWGGYLATRALLLAPEVYDVGIAVSPASDPAGKATVFEPYMGVPQGNEEAYEYASNIPFADKLEGKLLLIHGTDDVNAQLSQTMRLVDALVQAGKPHDLIILPGQDHYILHAPGQRADYARNAVRRYLVENLKP